MDNNKQLTIDDFEQKYQGKDWENEASSKINLMKDHAIMLAEKAQQKMSLFPENSIENEVNLVGKSVVNHLLNDSEHRIFNLKKNLVTEDLILNCMIPNTGSYEVLYNSFYGNIINYIKSNIQQILSQKS